jgi:aminoglycoside phosphotransferase (APT) family kinase protein
MQLRHGSLPPHLIAQIDSYLPPTAAVHTLISDASVPPSLLHGDLNDDNILGSGPSLEWKPCGIIDFADALSGDPLYDFVPLYISCFRCDKQRLTKFLLAYMRCRGWTLNSKELTCFRSNFSYRMMCYLLFHPVNVFATATVFRGDELKSCATLQEVERVLWSLEGAL